MSTSLGRWRLFQRLDALRKRAHEVAELLVVMLSLSWGFCAASKSVRA